jgi:hypothetical protein
MDLIDFLAARLDEDEAAAGRLATMLERQNMGGVWSSNGPLVTINTAWLPDRVLSEVATKRAILDRHQQARGLGDRLFCCWCSSDVDTEASLDVRWPCPDVRDIAAIWDGHPDYDPAWGPLPVAAH